ncbi:MAG: caspase family protein, partial [Pseudomonadota bacterium]
GFEVMKPVKNATRGDILDAIDLYTRRLNQAGKDPVGLVYYSGHGVASRGINYLIPVDVKEPSSRALRSRGVKQSEILSILRQEAPQAAHYLIIDACRNELRGARGGKGFVPVNQQSGILIAFATAPKATASDIGRTSGPYAKALAAELQRPGIDDLNMFHRVKIAVSRATGGDQVPWTLDGIQREKRLKFAGERAVTTTKASQAAQDWKTVQSIRNPNALLAFARRYDGTIFADMARAIAKDLQSRTAKLTPAKPAVSRPPRSTPPKSNDQARGPPLKLLAGEKRAALVIGNSGYLSIPSLPFAGNDARDMASMFENAGFSVQTMIDVDLRGFVSALSSFARSADRFDTIAVYLAGAGASVDGEEYFLPVDADIRDRTDIKKQGIPLTRLKILNASDTKLRLFIFDTLRKNAIAERFSDKRNYLGPRRSVPEFDRPAKGNTVLAFAAERGSFSRSGGSGQSVYVSDLVANLTRSDAGLSQILDGIRKNVMGKTSSRQKPEMIIIRSNR